MPFTTVSISEEIKKRRNESQDFDRIWQDSQEEYRLLGEMISLRKQQKITQAQLATMIGNKQQVISRIEKRENSPSLKLFCKMLEALGYELKIVKRG